MRICAVTILYNPGSFLADHIQSYLDSVEQLIIIDNSETDLSLTEAAINARFPGRKIRLIQNGRNDGIALALNKGLMLAEQEGFDWVLTMDQDSYFNGTDFFDAAAPLLQQPEIGILAASYREKNPFRQDYSAEFDQYLFVITSGNLVNIKAWKKVGGFENKLFIDEVDNDFCIRLGHNNFLVLASKRILLQHRLGNAFAVCPPFFKKSIPLGIHSPLRVKYITRNRCFVIKKYLFRYPQFCWNRFYHTCILFLFIIFLYPKKLTYLRYFFSGMADFLSSRYGKIRMEETAGTSVMV